MSNKSFKKFILICFIIFLFFNIELKVNAKELYTDDKKETIVTENLMSQYFQINWIKYNIEEKKFLNNLLVIEIAEDLKIDIPKIEYFYDSYENKFGYHILGENIIYLNEHKLYSAQDIYKTILHEMRHLWQWKRALNPLNVEDYIYKKNFDNYISSSDMNLYLKQPIEIDADSYANISYNELVNFGKKIFH